MVTINESSSLLCIYLNRRCQKRFVPSEPYCFAARSSTTGHPCGSALPREGKTTVAANLAVTLAQLGDKTVLVDADLRKPGVGRLLNLGEGKYPGLSSYLAGVSTLDLVTMPHPAIPNLAAIPTGPLPPNPADLLSSHKLTEAIAELRKKFKFVVIDSPPILAVTDGVILSVQADGVLWSAQW